MAIVKKAGMTDFDTVIIGSGAGGMTAALALAQAGQRALVLEQHDTPCGWCHSFTLEGYRFSPGVHYLGQLQPGGSLHRMYGGLGVSGRPELRDRARSVFGTRTSNPGQPSVRRPHEAPCRTCSLASRQIRPG